MGYGVAYAIGAAAALAAVLPGVAADLTPLSDLVSGFLPSAMASGPEAARLGFALAAMLWPLAADRLACRLRWGTRRGVVLAAAAIGGPLLGAVEPALLMAIAVLAARRGGAPPPLGVALAGLPRSPGIDSGAVVEVDSDGILALDAEGCVLRANAAAHRLLGGDPVGRPLARYLPRLAVEHGAIDALLGRRLETELQRESSQFLPVEVTFAAGDSRGRWCGQVRLTDISARAERLAELERLALHDALTGLPNRALFHDRVRQAIAVAERRGEPFAVMLLDLDRFKQINDTLGHSTGDLLLKGVGPRLGRALRKSDTLARFGGDEFAVLLPPPVDLEQAATTAERLVEAVLEPFVIEGMSLDLGVSVGTALYPEHGTDLDTLMHNADVAMYKAKRERLGFSVFNAEQAQGSARRLALQRDLRQAIEQDALHVLYQPKVAVAGWGSTGLEALVRWQHPTEGLLEPGDFLPIAEHTGLIMPLTLAVLNQCLEAQRSWRHAGIELPVSINISSKWLKDSEFPKILGLLLRNWHGRPEQLMIEIPESAVMLDPDGIIQTLDGVAKLGVGIVLDNFGTGYSSLPLLQRLPIKALKIDKTFVGDLFETRSASVIIRSIVKLAHGLGLRVIAEGVESDRTAEQLAGIGCDELQGFFVGRPMPAERLPAWLAEHATRRLARV